MHDDQHGTAVVALASVLSGCRATGIIPEKTAIGQGSSRSSDLSHVKHIWRRRSVWY